MLDRCARPGCPQVRFFRAINTYTGTVRRWFCSPVCSDLANKPVHWVPPGWSAVACGSMSTQLGQEHRFTKDIKLADCASCSRTGVYKKAVTTAA